MKATRLKELTLGRLAVGIGIALLIAVATPVPAWADWGTCGAIDPSCPCGVGQYDSCKTLWGCVQFCGCGTPGQQVPLGRRECHWFCDYAADGSGPYPMNVNCPTTAGCTGC